jgi:hypothetical protein
VTRSVEHRAHVARVMGREQCHEAAGHGGVWGEVSADEAAVELREVRPHDTHASRWAR